MNTILIRIKGLIQDGTGYGRRIFNWCIPRETKRHELPDAPKTIYVKLKKEWLRGDSYCWRCDSITEAMMTENHYQTGDVILTYELKGPAVVAHKSVSFTPLRIGLRSASR